VEKRKFAYINFDDERLVDFKTEDFNQLLQVFYELYGRGIEFFLFDEIQNIANWQIFINRLRRTKKIIITGSNAKLLSGELATFLTGRYLDFALYPFSFAEFLTYKGISLKEEDFYATEKISQIKSLLNNYLELGGFPEAYSFGKNILGHLYGDILTKDILLRYSIKNKMTFKEVSNYLLSNFGREITYRKLKNVFAIKNVQTMKNYIGYLTVPYLFILLERFSYKLKQRVIAPKKIYNIDNGLLTSLAFRFSENRGALIENLVLVEILRRKSYSFSPREVFYWKDHQGREVDFLIKEGNKVSCLLQVCVDLYIQSTKEREIKALIKAAEELRVTKLFIITEEKEAEEKVGRFEMRYIPLWKFLLKIAQLSP
jgi:predicted AAA+ superfamily ATPase